MELHYQIVAEARSWVGTPFQHQGRRKGQGADCLGLLVGVAAALRLRGRDGKLLASRDSFAYGHYPDEATLRAGLEECLIRLSHWERPQRTSVADAQADAGEGYEERCLHPHPKNAMHFSTSPNGRGAPSAAIALFRIDGSARHLGILASDREYPTLIHAYAPTRKVVEHRFCEQWQRKLVAVYQVS